jgi:DNA-binding transcriptional MerR regulator
VNTEIDREAYCARVGISQSALYDWVAKGVVVPSRVGPRRKQFFTEDDVRIGKLLRQLFEKHQGEYTLHELAAFARGEARPTSHKHGPPGSPRPFWAVDE